MAGNSAKERAPKWVHDVCDHFRRELFRAYTFPRLDIFLGNLPSGVSGDLWEWSDRSALVLILDRIALATEEHMAAMGGICHELAHGALGAGAGHGPEWQSLMTSIGLTPVGSSDDWCEKIVRDGPFWRAYHRLPDALRNARSNDPVLGQFPQAGRAQQGSPAQSFAAQRKQPSATDPRALDELFRVLQTGLPWPRGIRWPEIRARVVSSIPVGLADTDYYRGNAYATISFVQGTILFDEEWRFAAAAAHELAHVADEVMNVIDRRTQSTSHGPTFQAIMAAIGLRMPPGEVAHQIIPTGPFWKLYKEAIEGRGRVPGFKAISAVGVPHAIRQPHPSPRPVRSANASSPAARVDTPRITNPPAAFSRPIAPAQPRIEVKPQPIPTRDADQGGRGSAQNLGWAFFVDPSGSMNRAIPTSGGKRRIDLAREHLESIWPEFPGARVFLFRERGPEEVSSPSQIYLDGDGTSFHGIFEKAKAVGSRRISIISDGGIITPQLAKRLGLSAIPETREQVQRARAAAIAAGVEIITVHYIGDGAGSDSVEDGEFLQSLCYGGGLATAGQHPQDLAYALGAAGLAAPVTPPQRPRPDYAAERAAAEAHAREQAAMNAQFADLGDVIGGLADRVRTVEDRTTIRGTRDHAMAGVDRATEQAVSRAMMQLAADQKHAEDASANLRSDLQSIGDDIGGAMLASFGAQSQRKAQPDASAPVKIGGFDIDISVLSQANNLLTPQNASHSPARNVVPIQSGRRKNGW